MHYARNKLMQNINFDQSLKKLGRYAINAKRAKMILIAWFSLLLIIFILRSGYAVFQNSYLSHLIKKEKIITAEIEKLIQSSPKIKYIRGLKSSIDAFSEKINLQNNILKKMASYNAQLVQFKPDDYLNELANATTQQVWLTSIQFQNQGQDIHLAGFTLSASQLTQFVLRLQQENHFKDKPFAKMIITNPDNREQIPFVLGTQDRENKQDKKS